MIELKTSDTVPADIRQARKASSHEVKPTMTFIRLVEAVNFETDEALLTVESLPVQKDANATFEIYTGAGCRFKVAFSSSITTRGRGRDVVFATGMKTDTDTIATTLRPSGLVERILAW